jgi:stage II sporulation protein D
MLKKWVLFIFIFKTLTGFAEDVISVRVFAHLKVVSMTMVVEGSSYNLMADDKLIMKTNGETIFKLMVVNDSIQIKSFENFYGSFKNVKFISNDGKGELKLKLINPERKPRIYQDDINVTTEEGFLKIINAADLDNYIAGVVEAESGTHSTPEFYKVQAILARTFALAHINKHVLEGFSLCDQVHCQAYYGKPRYTEIYKIMEDTRGKVVVDENLNLIVAAFHSNSGGQTANSEDVWGARTTYLRSVNDTFSYHMPNYKWERKMLTDDWLQYLKIKHNYPIEDEQAKNIALNFRQWDRKVYLEAKNIKVPLKNVRQDLQLKSTLFSIYPDGDSVIFKGKGYGHSLGMSQEGAMRMTKLGYKHLDVLNFYYRNIQVIDMRKLSFFRDE